MNRQRSPDPCAAVRAIPFRAPWLVAVCALAIGSAGCYAHAYTSGSAVVEEPVVQAEVDTAPVEVQTVPVYVESYPSYMYSGRTVYLVDGRWYHRSGNHWRVYRAEPQALASVRVSYEARFGRHYRPRVENASPAVHPHPRPHHHH